MKISSVESVIRAFRAKYGRDALVPYADSDEDPYGTSFMIKRCTSHVFGTNEGRHSAGGSVRRPDRIASAGRLPLHEYRFPRRVAAIGGFDGWSPRTMADTN
jgi:hypothetical protein